jgi:hypothetical protein
MYEAAKIPKHSGRLNSYSTSIFNVSRSSLRSHGDEYCRNPAALTKPSACEQLVVLVAIPCLSTCFLRSCQFMLSIHFPISKLSNYRRAFIYWYFSNQHCIGTRMSLFPPFQHIIQKTYQGVVFIRGQTCRPRSCHTTNTLIPSTKATDHLSDIYDSSQLQWPGCYYIARLRKP